MNCKFQLVIISSSDKTASIYIKPAQFAKTL